MHGLQLRIGSSVSENAQEAWEAPVQGPGVPACLIQGYETWEVPSRVCSMIAWAMMGGGTLRQGLTYLRMTQKPSSSGFHFLSNGVPGLEHWASLQL